jgi:hypothetical protein
VTGAFLQDERLVDLMVRRTVEGLDAEASEELARRAARWSDYDDGEIDRVAAAVTLSGIAIRPLPTSLRQRLDASADDWIAQQADAVTAPSSSPVTQIGRPARATPAVQSPVGWLAAASLLIAAAGWWRVAGLSSERGALETRLAQVSTELSDTRAELEVSLDRLAALQSRAAAPEPGAEALTLSWSPTEDPSGRSASGQLVWDNERQVGYMRFAGLAANDPAESQYQLWIFDAERDDRHPVDGGVFDIPRNGTEAIVPIRAKLPVGQPVLFAVTVERPGGVVVSDRQRIAVVARPDQEI